MGLKVIIFTISYPLQNFMPSLWKKEWEKKRPQGPSQ